ncbi:MAG TPA: M90 family metallopeptidase [Burkholderiaceae bacterium]|jgi:hypothetical protein
MPDLQWLRQLFSFNKRHIPDPLWISCINRLPFLRSLSEADLVRLKELAEELLRTKTITGAAGLEITDEIAVSIVAQAALPVLNLTLDLYSGIPGIVVYPTAFVVNQKYMDAIGIVHEWRETLAGQAMDGGGAIVLAWDDVASNADFWSRRNVVIHEFAHKIDMQRSGANGCPPFLYPYHRGLRVENWQHAFTGAFNDFQRRVHSFESMHIAHQQPADMLHHLHEEQRQPLPMDPYAAKNPAEFFAVVSEVFFVAPTQLANDYPVIFQMLERYYLQKPLRRH